MRAIGLMSGTSLDGVDAALVETDGETVQRTGRALTIPYAAGLRAELRLLIDLGEAAPVALVADVADRITRIHAEAVAALGGVAELIGFHGQTILHAPDRRRTVQIGDPALLARLTGVPVACDFRLADVAAGGQGAPLAPVFHAALASALPRPLLVVNIGGVANVTFIAPTFIAPNFTAPTITAPTFIAPDIIAPDIVAPDFIAPDFIAPDFVAPECDTPEFTASHFDAPGFAAGSGLLACDTGPGNALLDDWMTSRTGAAMDLDGRAAASGTPDEAILAGLLADPFFALPAPKSLDRQHFAHALDAVAQLSTEDGAATLAAFTARAIAATPLPAMPVRVLVTGGGRHNAAIMAALAAAMRVPVAPVEAVGWDGDALEAQCFGFLGVRVLRGLPLSFPGTTGVPRAMPGGRIVAP